VRGLSRVKTIARLTVSMAMIETGTRRCMMVKDSDWRFPKGKAIRFSQAFRVCPFNRLSRTASCLKNVHGALRPARCGLPGLFHNLVQGNCEYLARLALRTAGKSSCDIHPIARPVMGDRAIRFFHLPRH
jgi:hypothetical protein